MDVIDDIENRRQELRLSQAEVANSMGVSQGQFSKVVSRKVPLTKKMSLKMNRWLEKGAAIERGSPEEILEKCIELMHLLQNHFGSADAEDPSRTQNRG